MGKGKNRSVKTPYLSLRFSIRGCSGALLSKNDSTRGIPHAYMPMTINGQSATLRLEYRGRKKSDTNVGLTCKHISMKAFSLLLCLGQNLGEIATFRIVYKVLDIRYKKIAVCVHS